MKMVIWVAREGRPALFKPRSKIAVTVTMSQNFVTLSSVDPGNFEHFFQIRLVIHGSNLFVEISVWKRTISSFHI